MIHTNSVGFPGFAAQTNENSDVNANKRRQKWWKSQSLSAWTPNDTTNGLRSWHVQEGARHLSVVCADGRFLRGLDPTISGIICTRPHPICSRVFVHLRTDAPCLSGSGRRFRKLLIALITLARLQMCFRNALFKQTFRRLKVHLGCRLAQKNRCYSETRMNSLKHIRVSLRIWTRRVDPGLETNGSVASESIKYSQTFGLVWSCAEIVLTFELLSAACLNIFPLHTGAAERSSQMGCLE